MSDKEPNSKESYGEVTLSRSFGLGTVTMIGVGGMIGAGIFALTGIAAGVAGPALVLAFLLNGCVTLLTAMAYAELGSAFPRAGGGYVWVKEALGGTQGFLAGWMSWFAYIAAGSLYSLTFGRFAGEIWLMAGLPMLGLTVHQMGLIFTVLIVIGFTALNRRGTSETGSVGNVVTIAKVVILAFFVFFGVLAMLRTDAWHQRFTSGFLPNGFGGILVAMGLTFIAFEGYEIIAQSAEEVIDPRRNIPKATFLSILIAVIIYILVGVTAIGATVAPEGMKVYEFLGQQKEVAIIDVAQQTFPAGIGAIVLLISGLVSTMSALNATTYSASRVSFAMGRDHNLPAFFALIHPLRHTPHWAVVASGVLMIALAFSLPIEHAGAAASIMFLLLFLQVNVAVMFLRRKMPDAPRGYKIPWYPAIPIIAVVFNLVLAANLFSFSPTAWYFAFGWIVIGLLVYYAYFSKIEAMEKPKEILLEEVLVSRDYSVLIPVGDREQARILGNIGSILASSNDGEVLALHAVQVPTQLDLSEGRLLLKESRPYLEAVIAQAKACDVPVHTMIRLCRRVADAVRKTAEENASNLILLGWPGYTGTAGRIFGAVIDDIVDNPPTDVAVVRHRNKRPLQSILIPVGGGPNTRLAVKLALGMASSCQDSPAAITLLHVIPAGARDADRVRAEQVLDEALDGTSYAPLEKRIVEGANVVDAVMEQAKDSDLIVVGATEEPLFKNLLVGTIPEQIARRANVSVIMVKRRSSPLHSFLRQTVLEPTTVRDSAPPRGKV